MMNNSKTAIAVAAALLAMAPLSHAAGSVSVKGQVNRAVMYADDGIDSDTFFVDNDTDSTRLNIIGEYELNKEYTVGGQFEVEHRSNSSADVTMNETKDARSTNAFTERVMEVYFKTPFGQLSLGQGYMASDATSESDFNATGLAGLYSYTGDIGGSLSFFRKNDASKVSPIVTISGVSDNFDGLNLNDRIRYDSPSFAGFNIAASSGTASQWDLALKYGSEFLNGDLKLAAALAYSDGGEAYDWYDQYNGSFAAEFKGFTLSLAAGGRIYDEDRDFADLNGDDPWTYYAKLGYGAKFNPIGKTSIAVDYKYSENYNVIDEEYTSYGVGLVQNLEAYGTDLYIAARNHSLDRPGVSDIEDIFTVIAGARVKF